MPELRVLPRVCRLLGICLRLATEWLPQAKEVVAVMWRKDEIEAMVFIFGVAVMRLVTSWTNGSIG
jgi:hypothetical protein